MASSSSSWLDEYMSALNARDVQEKAQEAAYTAYTKLADYTSTFQQSQAAGNEQARASIPTARTTAGKATKGSSPLRSVSPATGTATEAANDLTRLRTDLAAAQRSKATLQAQLSTQTIELQTLQKSSSTTTARLSQLVSEKGVLERKLRDREEELREKARLVQNVQDETMSLEIQINVAEQNVKRLEKENKDIIERFMRRVGQEADEMNAKGGWDGAS